MVDHNRQFESAEDPEFDQELRRALAPRNAPPDFAAHVMQRVSLDEQFKAQPAPQPGAMRPRRTRIFAFPSALRLAAIASLIIVVLVGSFTWQQHQQRIAGEHARQQVMTALQIANATLQQVADNVSSIQNRKDIQP